MKNSKAFLLIFVVISAFFSLPSFAETAVIVHPSNGNVLDSESISRIFLGKIKSFPNGDSAIPVNQQEGAAIRAVFDEGVLGKSSSQLKAYWSKLVFTGKGTPPRELVDDDEVIKLVAANPNLIGYIDAAKVDGSVKVVYKF